MYKELPSNERKTFCTSQARTVGFPRDANLWESAASILTRSRDSSLDLRLESSNWERLNHGLRGLRLHFDLLAESHPRACLGRWLLPGLDHAKPWDDKLSCLFHL